MPETHGLRQFGLRELVEFDDGRIAVAFDQAIARIAQDIDVRPGDDRPRKLTLEIAFGPEVDGSGLCDSVKMQLQVKDALPTRRSKVYDLGLRKGGLMIFQPLSLHDHNQQGLPFDTEDDES